MSDFLWGMKMTAVGMGTVFALLLLLMGVLLLVATLDDKPKAVVAPNPEPAPLTAAEPTTTPGSEPEAHPSVQVEMLTDELSVAEAAAVVLAVITHAQLRRQEAAPEMRTFAPGSQIHTSRWVSVGRASQNTSWNRR